MMTDEATRHLMVAVLHNAVNELKGTDRDTTRRKAEAAARFLVEFGPDWFKALDIPVPLEKFHDWIDSELVKWEER